MKGSVWRTLLVWPEQKVQKRGWLNPAAMPRGLNLTGTMTALGVVTQRRKRLRSVLRELL